MDETGIHRIDPAVIDTGVLQGQATGLGNQLIVRSGGTELGELRQAYANHIDATIHLVVLPRSDYPPHRPWRCPARAWRACLQYFNMRIGVPLRAGGCLSSIKW
ncbi:hypothetical protein D3C76_1447750 [compost metagenome]